MLFQNLNSFSFLIVCTITLLLLSFLYIFSQNHRKILKKYPLLLQGNSIKKQIFIIGLSIIILSIGVLKPSIEKFTENVSVDGLDVMVVLDVSKSMNAEDISDSSGYYTRIDVAKSLLGEIVINNPENRYGLVVFAGEAINVSPLTSDSQIFLNFLSGVNYRNVNAQGTDLTAAYTLGLERFINDENHGKALLLLSDGGDEEDNININEIKELLRDSGSSQTVIGIGTTQGAKIIKGRDIFGDINYEQYKGRDVVTKLNKDNLETLANIEGGDYYEVGELRDISSLITIFSDIEKKSIDQAGEKNLLDITRYISFLVFVLFLYFLIVPLFKKRA